MTTRSVIAPNKSSCMPATLILCLRNIWAQPTIRRDTPHEEDNTGSRSGATQTPDPSYGLEQVPPVAYRSGPSQHDFQFEEFEWLRTRRKTRWSSASD